MYILHMHDIYMEDLVAIPPKSIYKYNLYVSLQCTLKYLMAYQPPICIRGHPSRRLATNGTIK